MKRLSYGFGNCPIVSDVKHNISIHVYTDLPFWNFRVYNDIDINKATRMIRIMFTEAKLVDLREPGSTRWDINTIDLINLDKLISDNWHDMIVSYNEEIGDNQPKIPESLVKPDYTKLRNNELRESIYITFYEEES